MIQPCAESVVVKHQRTNQPTVNVSQKCVLLTDRPSVPTYPYVDSEVVFGFPATHLLNGVSVWLAGAEMSTYYVRLCVWTFINS